MLLLHTTAAIIPLLLLTPVRARLFEVKDLLDNSSRILGYKETKSLSDVQKDSIGVVIITCDIIL